MTDIKPIETNYKGCRFRSRLEARWAVFFDNLGIEWEYEPEGFELPDGTRYLPDFYLPKEEAYVEIKAPRPGCVEELRKAVGFVDGSKIKRLLILTNIPEVSKGVPLIPMIHFDCRYLTQMVCWFEWFCPEDICFISPTSHETFADLWLNTTEKLFDKSPVEFEKNINRYYEESERVIVENCRDAKAYMAARSARFEFGEEG